MTIRYFMNVKEPTTEVEWLLGISKSAEKHFFNLYFCLESYICWNILVTSDFNNTIFAGFIARRKYKA